MTFEAGMVLLDKDTNDLLLLTKRFDGLGYGEIEDGPAWWLINLSINTRMWEWEEYLQDDVRYELV